MFGYCFSNALISTVRASLAPVPVSGLADQTMLPDVAEPQAELVGEPTAVAELRAAAAEAVGRVRAAPA